LEAADAVKFVLMVGIMLTVISVGLRSRPADTVLLLRNPKLGVRAMVSMFVVMPLFVIGLTWVLPVMDQAAHAALVALSVSPMPPILPRRQAKVGAGGDYAVGLQVLASVFSIIVAPAFIWLAGRLEGVATVFDATAALRVLALTIGAPLAAGILIARLWPRAAALSTLLARAALVVLAAGGAVALFAEASKIAAQIGHGVLLVTAAIVLFGLLAGHLLGGPDAGNRGALALATSARHPGLAIALSTASFPHDKEAIVAAVLLFLLTNLVLTLPYALWRQRRAHPAGHTDGNTT
jgi:bile acid:Na+ symporter, BASS family